MLLWKDTLQNTTSDALLVNSERCHLKMVHIVHGQIRTFSFSHGIEVDSTSCCEKLCNVKTYLWYGKLVGHQP